MPTEDRDRFTPTESPYKDSPGGGGGSKERARPISEPVEEPNPIEVGEGSKHSDPEV